MKDRFATQSPSRGAEQKLACNDFGVRAYFRQLASARLCERQARHHYVFRTAFAHPEGSILENAVGATGFEPAT